MSSFSGSTCTRRQVRSNQFTNSINMILVHCCRHPHPGLKQKPTRTACHANLREKLSECLIDIYPVLAPTAQGRMPPKHARTQATHAQGQVTIVSTGTTRFQANPTYISYDDVSRQVQIAMIREKKQRKTSRAQFHTATVIIKTTTKLRNLTSWWWYEYVTGET